MKGLLHRSPVVISLDKHGLYIAQIKSGDAKRVKRFDLPQSLDWASKALVDPLTRFIHEGGWSGCKVTLSLSSEFCIFRSLTLPEMEPTSLISAIAIQCEQQFNQNGHLMAVDYTPPVKATGQIQTMLVATPMSFIESLKELFAAVGIHISSVTASVIVMTEQLPATNGPTGVLHVSDHYAALILQNHQQVVSVTHTTCQPDEMLDVLRQELKQLRLIMAGQDQQQAFVIKIFNDSSIDEQSLQDIVGASQMTCDKQPTSSDCPHVITSLAFTLTQGSSLAVDFVHSRLSVKPPARLGNRFRRIAAAVAVIMVAAFLYLWDISATSAGIAQLDSQLTSMREDIVAAQNMIDRTVYARKWFSRQPRHLECQKSLAEAFGYEGRTWAASIAIRDDLTGLVTGNALTERDVLEFLDRLKNLNEMKSVKLVYVRESSGESSHVGFAIRFQFSTGGNVS